MADPFMAAAAELNMLRCSVPQMQHIMNELGSENTSLKMERGALLHELHLKNLECAAAAEQVAVLKQQLQCCERVDVGVQATVACDLVNSTSQTAVTHTKSVGVSCLSSVVDNCSQTSATRTKGVGVQFMPETAVSECQTQSFAPPVLQEQLPETNVNCHAWMQKLWLLVTTGVLCKLKPSRSAFVQHCALLLRCWYIYTPCLFVVGERTSDISYQCVDDDMLPIVKRAPAFSFVLSTQPYKRWPPNSDELRKSNMRFVRSVYAQMANVLLTKFVPHLLRHLRPDMLFKSAVPVKVAPLPSVLRVVHAESSSIMEYVLPMNTAVGVLLTLPNGQKWVMSFASIVQHAKEDVVGEASTMVDFGQTERLLNSSDCSPITDTELAILFTNHLTNAQNLTGVKADEIVNSLRPALKYTFDSMEYLCEFTHSDRDALISKMLTWAKKLVKAADKDARLSRSDMLCLPL